MKRRKFWLIVFLVVSFVQFARETVEELERKIASVSKAEKVNILNRLSAGYLEKSPKRAVVYGEQALTLARELEDRRAEAAALQNIGIGFKELSDYRKALAFAQESLQIFEEINDRKGISDALINIGVAHLYLGDYDNGLACSLEALEMKRAAADKRGIARSLSYVGVSRWLMGDYKKALEYHRGALKLAEEIGDKRLVANSLNHIGMVYQNLGNYDKTLDYYFKSLKLRKEIEDQKAAADSYNNIGIVYKRMGILDKSLEYHLKSLKIKEEIADKRGIAVSLNNIGTVYLHMENHRQALEYMKRSLKIKQEIGLKKEISSTLRNVGIIYRKINDYQEALVYLTRALRISEQIDDKYGAANCVFEIGLTYCRLKNWPKALDYHSRALERMEEIGDKSGMAAAFNNLGLTHLGLRNYREAEAYLQKGLATAKEVKSDYLLKEAYDCFYRLHSSRGNYREALEHYILYEGAKDRILNERSRKQVSELQIRYETEKKQKAIALLEKENELQRIRLKNERLTRNAFIIGLILVLTILVLFFKKYLTFFAFWKKKNYIGHYKIVERVGSGGVGTVYKAVDMFNKSTIVAVKVLRDEYMQDPAQRKRFIQEASVADQIDHPNVTRVIERGEHEGSLFIVMEYLHGETLAEKIRKEGRLSWAESLEISLQLTNALAKIHEKGIVHRDLKPENVMLLDRGTRDHFVKLLDFGLAKTGSLSNLTETGLVMGTLHYIAPEQISGSLSASSDIYSLGAIFYEMVSGEKTFLAETATYVVKHILNDTPVEPVHYRPDIHPAYNKLIMNMLKKEPGLRPAVNEILEELENMK